MHACSTVMCALVSLYYIIVIDQVRSASNAVCCLKQSQYEAVVDFLISEFCQRNMKLKVAI